MTKNNKKEVDTTVKAKRWCATIYKEEDLESLKTSAEIKYYCIGYETCPTTGNKHYQCYFELLNQQRFSYIKKNILKVSYFAKAEGTAHDSYIYCSKECGENNLMIKGTPAVKGDRNDLKKLVSEIVSGKSIKDIITDDRDLALKSKQIEHLKSIFDEPRTTKPEVIVYWGLSGTGKTYKALTDNKGKCYIVTQPNNNNLWFDGYDNIKHETIIFEEFNGWIPFNDFKVMCDNTPYKVNIKGGFIQFKPKQIIFISNYHPYTWYKELSDVDLKAFKRRINYIKYFDKLIDDIQREPIDETPQHILDRIDPLYNFKKSMQTSLTNKDLMI